MGPDKRRILGIDPGSRFTGFGVLDFVGDRPATFPQPLNNIFDSVSDIVSEYQPDIVAIESVFMARNAGSALKLGHARSAALCATFAYDVEVFEYAPREIKQAVVGTGSASKEQVQHMVVSILQLDGVPAADAADALATAICHGNQRGLRSQLDDRSAIASLR
jgi:crossover junction endodeoxyribonuclease RuvC